MVLHGLDKVLEGGAVVKTLRDHSIPSNGDIKENWIYLFVITIFLLVHLENEKPITESGDEISYEGAKAKSLISLLSGLRRRSTLVQFGPFYLFSFLMVWSQQMELNRAHAKFLPSHHERKESIGAPIKLDVESHAHIQKHRKLQEDLTDEMVELTRRRKEISLMMVFPDLNRNLTSSKPKADELAASEMVVAYGSSNWALLVEG
ncbi:hypothetical protein Zm00014a_043520 [Zea mays]|uniref:Uncharacterized protein n=2 Tax=Zea mays TaxID=4577 RepID=A0A1D6LIU6_MAIZE|nr:hypothetical protein ZEAMMB73_Zm00001d035800 [Zea mays]PWZ18510.1 hypothetical protein Zm00014a_043520 [Zea mays]